MQTVRSKGFSPSPKPLIILLSSLLAFLLSTTPTVAAELGNSLSMPAVDQATSSSPVPEFLKNIPQGFYTTFKTDKIKAQIKEEDAVLIDVRQPSEYESGHIPEALNIPLRQLAENLDKIPKDRPVIVYCSTGYRTGMGVMALQLLGYDNVSGFPPSFQGWKESGEKVE
ncbi:rhodanese-like domain-containing protein [Spirulina sp. CS-785/01]|uniref:rhodanese-like domain-containing protein n=1 Tax=Spirulina sp. CS-785/01 TaxID=3021716 RepID=UPI0023302140|nr:rhodanese-like domain-containing protein [Spirulina sp. CS-785/01]MDB9313787.1 rhodanese-like domain-containing protein [Spirulina sp. CS-785/01]